jgi:dolichol-phosphate mannosyltransferase
MLIHRDALARVGGFAAVRASVCEDVTVARCLAADDWAVGFYESEGLVSTRMYEGGWETMANWTRSLPLRDHLTDRVALVGLIEVTLAQALPLAILVVARSGMPVSRLLLMLNLTLLATRLGVLVGTARAYTSLPLTYWISPLVDLPAIVQLWRSALTREHIWRGRPAFRGVPGAMP